MKIVRLILVLTTIVVMLPFAVAGFVWEFISSTFNEGRTYFDDYVAWSKKGFK